jgi:hypothetical protein
MAEMEVLDFTYSFLLYHPEAHKQGYFFEGLVECHATTKEELVNAYEVNVCGTSGCLGGYGALFAGYHQVRGYYYDENGRTVYGTDNVVDEEGNEYSMAEAGRLAFGISEEQAMALFHGENTIDALGNMIEALRADGEAYLRPYMTRNNPVGCECSMCVGQNA